MLRAGKVDQGVHRLCPALGISELADNGRRWARALHPSPNEALYLYTLRAQGYVSSYLDTTYAHIIALENNSLTPYLSVLPVINQYFKHPIPVVYTPLENT